MNFLFEVGEIALDSRNREVVIVEKALRPQYYANRQQYKVRRRGFFKDVYEWEIEANLTQKIK